MAALAPPVQVVADGAPPFVHVASGAPPFVAVSGNAPPITIVADGAPPITLLNEDGSIWTGGGGTTPVGGAAILADETDGFATDFMYATDAERVAVKTAGTVVASGLNTFYQNGGTSPKQVWDSAGTLGWAPHNQVLQSEDFTSASWTKSATPVVTAHTVEDNSAAAQSAVTQSIVTIVGATCIAALWFLKDAVTTRWPGMMVTGSATFVTQLNTSTGAIVNSTSGLSGVSAVEDTGTHWKLTQTFVADATTIQLRIYPAYAATFGGSAVAAPVGVVTVDKVQWNRGSTLTAYLTTLSAVRVGLAVDHDPVTHVARGLLCEPAATNILLNATTLSTQSVTVTAVAHTLSFLGTGTVTLSGVSTAGPLVGTGASNLVSLTFTPTAGSLTLTVTGTVSNAQLETGTIATSRIQTFGASATRAADNCTFLLSTIPALGSEYSIYVRFSTPSIASGAYVFNLNSGVTDELAGFVANTTGRLVVNDNNVNVGAITGATLVANTPVSIAARFELNDLAMSIGGAAVGTDVTATLPTPTAARFGNAGGAVGSTAVFYMEKVAIVMPGWDNATLVTKSAT